VACPVVVVIFSCILFSRFGAFGADPGVPVEELEVGLMADGAIAHVFKVSLDALSVQHRFNQFVKFLPELASFPTIFG